MAWKSALDWRKRWPLYILVILFATGETIYLLGGGTPSPDGKWAYECEAKFVHITSPGPTIFAGPIAAVAERATLKVAAGRTPER